MTNREVALRYLDAFCAADLAGLQAVLTEDVQFAGSLFQFHNRDDYLACLQHDPPEPGRYTLLSVTEAADSVAIFYLYETPGRTLKPAQLFRFRDQRICRIDLIFDTRDFH